VGINTYGAMITLAPGMGRLLSSSVSGTRPRNSSSCRESSDGSSSYQEPAWLASRVPILAVRKRVAGVSCPSKDGSYFIPTYLVLLG